MERPRRKSRAVYVGDVQVGGGAPISVQSMTVSKTHDVAATLAEINGLAEAGADIVRVAVPRPEDAEALADIHTPKYFWPPFRSRLTSRKKRNLRTRGSGRLRDLGTLENGLRLSG